MTVRLASEETGSPFAALQILIGPDQIRDCPCRAVRTDNRPLAGVPSGGDTRRGMPLGYNGDIDRLAGRLDPIVAQQLRGEL
jgi:hypothetical protein